MDRVITPQRMRAEEAAFIAETGTPGLLLMERAAQAVAEALAGMTPEGALFLCGPGNNGGDGYAAARLFAQMGRKAVVWALSGPETLAGDAKVNHERCVALGIPVEHITSFPQATPEGIGAVVDALFGTGLARPLTGLYAQAAAWLNLCGLPVLAVDMPSGTPELMVRAQRTVTFHRRKTVHLLFPGRANAGEVTVADIGLPDSPSTEDFTVLGPEDIPALLPPRPPDAHKGTAGTVLLLCGSVGMAGAAALCATGALRGGAGLVTVACPEALFPIVQTLAPCAMCVPRQAYLQAAAGKSALGVGPGLGQGPEADAQIEAALSVPCRQVWDADALNWLAAHPAPLGERFIITPHAGEAARLLGCSTHRVTEDPVAAAEALHEIYGAAVLLKGATTVLVEGRRRGLNVIGSPGMATGGSGDVLTGLIAALLAQGLAPFDAAQLGALVHGMAGCRAAGLRGVRAMTAQDLLDCIHLD